jgi:hypothetical protein
MRWTPALVITLLMGMGWAQLNAPLQPTPLEAFVRQPNTRLAWSTEVGRIDTSRAHAIATAVIVEDTAQPPDRMRGIRILLSDKDRNDEVYLGEETLVAYRDALDEISQEAARERDQGTARPSSLKPDGKRMLELVSFGTQMARPASTRSTLRTTLGPLPLAWP